MIEVKGVNLLSVLEAARRLDMDESQLRVMLRKKRIPGIKLGRDWAIRESDVIEFKKNPVGRPPATKKKTTKK
jgi:excisionase family DNA binding protein